MKICMLAPEFLPVWGGVGTYIVELTKHLPKNIDIHIVTPLRKGFGKEKISLNLKHKSIVDGLGAKRVFEQILKLK